MSAQQLGVITIAFPDPAIPSTNNGVYEQIPDSQGFSLLLNNNNNLQTLSSSGAPDTNTIKGLMYVPDLQSEGCINASAPYVPTNATRRANLPDTDYILMALAPWFSNACAQEYLASTENLPIHGFITYIPNNTSTSQPPPVNDPVWRIGNNWNLTQNFPVWAVSGVIGDILMTQLNLYSKNLTDVPNGHELASDYPASDYVRLYGIVQIADRNSLPSLWVFLLITLGLLILIIGITSLTMHILQRRRRASLRRRVVAGEVDLEALGVKRLTVPQEVLDKMPVYTYKMGALPERGDLVEPGAPDHTRLTSFSQPTCAICLEDFIENETSVRELPCRHVFHPECVDTFLLNNSSLCPMCKHSTLPKGYCPATITNAMVRRERLAARNRERAALPRVPQNVHTGQTFLNRVRGLFGSSRQQQTPSQAQTPAVPPTQDIEMGTTATPAAPAATQPPATPTAATAEPCPAPSPAQGQNRREWARNRAVRMLGVQRVLQDAEDDERRTPGWKKFIRRIFPS